MGKSLKPATGGTRKAYCHGKTHFCLHNKLANSNCTDLLLVEQTAFSVIPGQQCERLSGSKGRRVCLRLGAGSSGGEFGLRARRTWKERAAGGRGTRAFQAKATSHAKA